MKKTIEAYPAIDINKVGKVYTGKPGKCMCGCAGKYKYASSYQKEGGKERGYAVPDCDVSDRRVATVVRHFRNSYPIEILDGKIFTSVIGKTQYTVYYKKA